MTQRACILVPVYNHAAPLRRVLDGLKPLGLPCLLMDDGSDAEEARALEALARDEAAWVRLRRQEPNQGKGAATRALLLWAAQEGFSHGLQVDADGQHDIESLPLLLDASGQWPERVVCARPVFDGSAPAGRLWGRRLTNFWVAVNTLSLAIPDAMCGLRVYPLAAVAALLRRKPMGNRMSFDIEILVRLKWAGVRPLFVPARVRYPEGGRSHFLAWRDNALISWAHTRLFFGMLKRLPWLLLGWPA